LVLAPTKKNAAHLVAAIPTNGSDKLFTIFTAVQTFDSPYVGLDTGVL
jgi:hypothetical protein